MTNAATAKSIITNIETILTTLGWKLEDLSSLKSDLSSYTSNPGCMLLLTGGDFEENYNEVPKYNTLDFTIVVVTRYSEPAAARDKAIDCVYNLREGIKPSTLNVGGLATTKYVFNVDHKPFENEFEDSINVLRYNFSVMHREI